MIHRLRYRLGRALIHAGLRAMPPGRVRDEIHAALAGWAGHVRATVRAHGEPRT